MFAKMISHYEKIRCCTIKERYHIIKKKSVSHNWTKSSKKVSHTLKKKYRPSQKKDVALLFEGFLSNKIFFAMSYSFYFEDGLGNVQ